MPRMTKLQFAEWCRKRDETLSRGEDRHYAGDILRQGLEEVLRESDLHDQIMAWCNSQWPRWKFIHSRMDRATTNEKGVADFVIFGPHPLVLLVEAKSKAKKQSEDQLAWAAELRMLGWTVHVVRSMQDFTEVIEAQIPPYDPPCEPTPKPD